MKFLVRKKLPDSYRNIFRKLSYQPDNNRKTGDESYSRRLGRERYPRFHVYINQRDNGTEVNLHLDMKKPSYDGNHAHNAEYDGDNVSNEAIRIHSYLKDL